MPGERFPKKKTTNAHQIQGGGVKNIRLPDRIGGILFRNHSKPDHNISP